MATLTDRLLIVPAVGQSLADSDWKTAHRRFTGADIDSVGGDTLQLFQVPAGTLVHSVLARVRGAWTTSTITLGDGASAAGFMSSADIAPGTAENSTGVMKNSRDLGEAYATGKHYVAEDTIDAVVGGTPSAGTLDVFLIFAYVGSIDS